MRSSAGAAGISPCHGSSSSPSSAVVPLLPYYYAAFVAYFLLLFSLVPFSSSIQLLTRQNGPSEDQVPDPPTNFRAEQLTPNSVTLRWNPPLNVDNVLVRGYTLSYGTDTVDARKVVLEGVDSLEYRLNGLRPNTSYVFSLTAYNEAYGEDSARVLLQSRTPALPARDWPEPAEDTASRPTGLRAQRTKQRTEVMLHWEEEPGEAKPVYYVVQYSRDSVREREQHRLSVERSPALLTGLRQGERYTAKVRSVFADGSQSAWSDKLTLNGGREKNRNRMGGAWDAEQEEDFCGFELSSVCDFIREGPWRWQRRNSTKDGFNMMLHASVKERRKDEVGKMYGRLLSPVYGLRPSDTFCASVQMKSAKGGFGALFRIGVRFEAEPRPVWIYKKSLQRVWPQAEWHRLSFQLRRRPPSRGFQLMFDVSKSRETGDANLTVSLDNLFVQVGECPAELEPYFGAAPDEETEANLLIPLENLIETDPRISRTPGLDGLPAVGIRRGVEIVVPYRIYLPRKFYRNFAILASIRPSDHQGGYLFAVLNAFDTVVELGLKLEPAGPSQTNISLLYTDSSAERDSRVLASFVVPAFTGQWTQFAMEVHENTVGLYFRCMRFAIRQVHRHPAQLQMDDASKLYIANAGPILGGGFEGAIQELKLHDDPAEAANQCNENWWKTRRRDFSSRQNQRERVIVVDDAGGRRQPEKDAERGGDVAGAASGFGPPEEEDELEEEEEEDRQRINAAGSTEEEERRANQQQQQPTAPPQHPPHFPPNNKQTTYEEEGEKGAWAQTDGTFAPLLLTTAQPPATTMTTTSGIMPSSRTTESGSRRQIVVERGPKGDKGDRGEAGPPGTCVSECRIPPPGPPGLPGPPGEFPGLTEADLARIVSWPGVKGEKGECVERPTAGAMAGAAQRQQQKQTHHREEQGEEELVLLPDEDGRGGKGELPLYNSRMHGGPTTTRWTGQKGNRGPPGLPGPPGPPATVQSRQTGQYPSPSSPPAAAVSVYQTALELLAAAPKCPIGALAFAISTQQLFLRVHAGWRQVMLEKTLLAAHSPAEQQQQTAQQQRAPQAQHQMLDSSAEDDSELNRLAYWLALDEPNGDGNEGDDGAMPLPPSAPAVVHHPWRARWPPKEIKVLEEDLEAEKVRNRVEAATAIKHKDKVIHLIALNQPIAGDFGGVRGADLECYRQARQAGFGTTFRAFVSSRVQDLNKLVHADDRHHTPVVNLQGERLFDSWNSVFDGGAHSHVPLYSFDRRDVLSDRAWADRWLWHGSTSEGLRSSAFCGEWRSASGAHTGLASPLLHSRHALTDQSGQLPCSRRLAVLCVEVMSKFNVDRKLGKRFMAADSPFTSSSRGRST